MTPDLAVISGTPRQVATHPERAVLIVEVSDATLEFGQKLKSAAYAGNGILEYWIVNLKERCLEVRRNPTSGQNSAQYSDVRIFKPDEFVSPLSAESSKIAVAELLPQKFTYLTPAA